MNTLLFRNARVVLPDQTIDTANVLLNGDRIAAIQDSSSSLPPASSAFDLAGMTLMPGFIDVHIHGAAGVDAMDARADDMRHVAAFLARHGVTSWLPTLVPARSDEYERAVRAIEEAMKEQAGSPRT